MVYMTSSEGSSCSPDTTSTMFTQKELPMPKKRRRAEPRVQEVSQLLSLYSASFRSQVILERHHEAVDVPSLPYP